MAKTKDYNNCSFLYSDLLSTIHLNDGEIGAAVSLFKPLFYISGQNSIGALRLALQNGGLSDKNKDLYSEDLYKIFKLLYLSELNLAPKINHETGEVFFVPQVDNLPEKIQQAQEILQESATSLQAGSITALVSQLIMDLKQQEYRKLCLDSMDKFEQGIFQITTSQLKENIKSLWINVNGETKSFSEWCDNKIPDKSGEIIRILREKFHLRDEHLGFVLKSWNQAGIVGVAKLQAPLIVGLKGQASPLNLSFEAGKTLFNIKDGELTSITRQEDVLNSKNQVKLFSAKLEITLPDSKHRIGHIKHERLAELLPYSASAPYQVKAVRPLNVKLTFASESKDVNIQLPKDLKVTTPNKIAQIFANFAKIKNIGGDRARSNTLSSLDSVDSMVSMASSVSIQTAGSTKDLRGELSEIEQKLNKAMKSDDPKVADPKTAPKNPSRRSIHSR